MLLASNIAVGSCLCASSSLPLVPSATAVSRARTLVWCSLASNPGDGGSGYFHRWDMDHLHNRISKMAAESKLHRRFLDLDRVYLLFLDIDTDNESLYIHDSAQYGADLLLAFESVHDAESFALSVCADLDTSVLDTTFTALVESSFGTSLKVGVIFDGDVKALQSQHQSLILPAPAPDVTYEVSSVPAEVYNSLLPDGASSLPLADDETGLEMPVAPDALVWVLMHDAGTADAQFHTIIRNGTQMVVSFRDEGIATRHAAEAGTNVSPMPMYLDDVLDALHERDDADDTLECAVGVLDAMHAESADSCEVLDLTQCAGGQHGPMGPIEQACARAVLEHIYASSPDNFGV